MSEFDQYFALYDKGAYRQAYEVLRDIMASEPRWSAVGDMYVWCANLELTLNDDIARTRELLDTALRLGCEDIATYYCLHGYVLCRQGDWDDGIRDLERSVELDPTVPNLVMLGKMLSCRGDARAPDIWARVLQQDPEDCRAHIYLGTVAAQSGDKGKALLMAKRAEELRPTVQNLEEIARLYSEAGEPQTALDKYYEVERLWDGSKASLYAGIATCHFDLGNEQEGCVYLERARGCDPDHVDVKRVWESYKDRCVKGK